MWRRVVRWWIGPSMHSWSSWELGTLMVMHGLFQEHRQVQRRTCLICGFTQEAPIGRPRPVDEHVDFSILRPPVQ